MPFENNVQGHWELIYTFNDTNTLNTGHRAIVSPSPSMCTEQNPAKYCPLYSFGVFHVSGIQKNTNGIVSLNKRPPHCANVTSHNQSAPLPPGWLLSVIFVDGRLVFL